MQITLRAARVNANMKLKEVANVLGVTIKTAWSYEVGKCQPNVQQVKTLLDLYNVKFEDVIFLPECNTYGDTEQQKRYERWLYAK